MGTSVGSRVALAVLLAVLVAGATSLAAASKVTIYGDMGCQGDTHLIMKCGYCQKLILFGGYEFVYSDEQPLKLYSSYDCSDEGVPLNQSVTSCGGALKYYRSVKLFCSPSEAAAAAV